MGESLLIIAVLLQLFAVVQAVRLVLQQRRAGWVFVSLAIALMLARRVFTMVAVFSHAQTADAVAESIALLISVLMAIGLTLLLAWSKQDDRDPESAQAVESGARQRLKRQAILLALVSLLGCAGLGYFAYGASRDEVTGRLLKGSLDLAHMLETSVRPAPDRATALAELNRLWTDAPSQYADNYLCVIGADGKLQMNTRWPEKVGLSVGAIKLPEQADAPRSVQGLVAARRDWVGRNRTVDGEPQLCAYAYSPVLDALVAVHLPARSVDAQIRAAALPWGAGIAVIFLVILPLSFGLLFHVGSVSEKAALQSLRGQLQSERRYSLLIENVRDHAIFLLDAEGRVSTWNPGAEIVRGWTEAEIQGRHLSAFYTPEDVVAGLPEKDLQSAAANGSMSTEGWRLRKDGSRFWAGVTISRGRDGAGGESGYLVVMRDITERRQAEEESRISAARFAAVFRSNPAAIGMNTLVTGRFIEVNAQVGKFFGWTRAEMIGKTIFELGIWVDPAQREPLIAQVHATGSVRDAEVQLRRRSGEVRDALLSMERIEVPGETEPVLVVMFTDLTDRKRAEEALHRSEANYRTLIESASDGILVSDSQNRLLDVNAAACRMLGYTREELLGMTAAEILAEPEAARIAPETERVGAGEVVHSEWQWRRKDGTVFPGEISATRLPDGRFLGILRDVTERRLAEQHIRQLNRTYAVLSEINQLIVRERAPQKLLEEACLIAVATGGFRMAWIGLRAAAGGRTEIAAHAGASEKTLERLEAIINNPLPSISCVFTQQSLATGEHGVCNDIENDPRAACWKDAALRRDYHSMVALPLKSGGKVVGTFNLYASEPAFFDEHELELLDELAKDIGFAMEISQREGERKQAEEKVRTQLDELLRWQNVMIAREERVDKLKAEVNAILNEHGEPIRYPSQMKP